MVEGGIGWAVVFILQVANLFTKLAHVIHPRVPIDARSEDVLMPRALLGTSAWHDWDISVFDLVVKLLDLLAARLRDNELAVWLISAVVLEPFTIRRGPVHEILLRKLL